MGRDQRQIVQSSVKLCADPSQEFNSSETFRDYKIIKCADQPSQDILTRQGYPEEASFSHLATRSKGAMRKALAVHQSGKEGYSSFRLLAADRGG